jgi:hypothetical protein
VIVNDLDESVQVVVSRTDKFKEGSLFQVDFDRCAGAAAPKSADFTCTVADCASSFGAVTGCTCAVELR